MLRDNANTDELERSGNPRNGNNFQQHVSSPDIYRDRLSDN